ncbi:hypothetical protein BU17DRAFT_62610 [Hysterangium stoloniferum]|nr:hypothetical protein BU17DRAFT_62610 [Hysterangium stoloniferum]
MRMKTHYVIAFTPTPISTFGVSQNAYTHLLWAHISPFILQQPSDVEHLMILIDLNNIPTTSTPATATATVSNTCIDDLPVTSFAKKIKEHSERRYELAKNLKEHSERSGWCRLAKDLKKYSEKSGGAAKNLKEHSDRKDGYAKNLKHHSKRSVKLAQILRSHPERSIKLAQTLREHSEKNTNCANNLKEHSGRNELTKHIGRHSGRSAQLANDLEKHLGNAKLTKNFDGSSGWLQQLFAQGVSILHQQKISLECFYETTAERKSSLSVSLARKNCKCRRPPPSVKPNDGDGCAEAAGGGFDSSHAARESLSSLLGRIASGFDETLSFEDDGPVIPCFWITERDPSSVTVEMVLMVLERPHQFLIGLTLQALADSGVGQEGWVLGMAGKALQTVVWPLISAFFEDNEDDDGVEDAAVEDQASGNRKR